MCIEEPHASNSSLWTLYPCKSQLCKAVLDGAIDLTTKEEGSTVTHRSITLSKRNMTSFIHYTCTCKIWLLATSFCWNCSLVLSSAIISTALESGITWQATCTVSPWWTSLPSEKPQQFPLRTFTTKHSGWKYWIGYRLMSDGTCVHVYQTIGISVKTHIDAIICLCSNSIMDCVWAEHTFKRNNTILEKKPTLLFEQLLTMLCQWVYFLYQSHM